MKIRELNSVNLRRQLGSKWFLLTPISGHFGGYVQEHENKVDALEYQRVRPFWRFLAST